MARRATERRRGRALGAALLASALPAAALAQAPLPSSAGVPGVPGTPGATPIGVGANPEGRRLVVEPGVRVRVDASTNPDLQPDATAKSGTLLEVTPFVTATLNSPRGVASLAYGLRGLLRDGGTNPRDEIRHDLRAWGDVRITDDSVRLLARANVFDISASPFGSGSFDPAIQTTNRTQYRDFELSPYAFGRFDGEGRWTARYSLRHIDPGSSIPSNLINEVSGFARSDLVRRRFGFSLSGNASSVDYQNGLDYDGGAIDLLGWYRVDPRLRVGAGMGYSWNSALATSNGDTSGFGATASVEWTPDPRTYAIARWSDRYYGNSIDVRASHRAANWTFGLVANQGLTDGNRSGLYGLNTAGLFNAGAPLGQAAGTASNPVAQSLSNQGLLPSAGASYGSGAIQSPLVYNESLVASVGWSSVRNSVLGTLFVNNRRTAVAFAGGTSQDIDQWGGSLGWTHRLTERNAVSTTARFTRSDDNLTGASSDLTGLWASFDRRITPRSVASLGGRVQRQRGNAVAVTYDEAAVFATVDYRF
ncbi:MAG: TIGR03016 family PEP-CTERM system-associated outer membrane protein [Burkholderiales bacterium]